MTSVFPLACCSYGNSETAFQGKSILRAVFKSFCFGSVQTTFPCKLEAETRQCLCVSYFSLHLTCCQVVCSPIDTHSWLFVSDSFMCFKLNSLWTYLWLTIFSCFYPLPPPAKPQLLTTNQPKCICKINKEIASAKSQWTVQTRA